ncbi:MAG: DUF2845 domain-containing protein [Phycisphaeraceae bacterium]|nr:MAG: DUF2845 domain-containing protein [Phycisphaeraceae bacterium]
MPRRSPLASLALCALLLLVLPACAAPAPADRLSELSDHDLQRQLRWVARGPDDHRVFREAGGRAAYMDRLRTEILDRHPQWPDDVRAAIEDGVVTLGMHKDQVQAAAGWPNEYPRRFWPPRTSFGMDGERDLEHYRWTLPLRQWTYGRSPGHVIVFFDAEERVERIRDNRKNADVERVRTPGTPAGTDGAPDG